MKFSILRALVVWRRLRHGVHHRQQKWSVARQLESLLRRANPFAPWHERANWLADVSEWLRRVPDSALSDDALRDRLRQQRLRFVLDWLDTHRSVKKLVQASAQKTFREAVGPELFSAAGMPREPAFFSELSERFMTRILPRPNVRPDLPALLSALFPEPADAEWLRGLDRTTMGRLSKLCMDDGIGHAYRVQIDEALVYLATNVASTGIGPDFRERLDEKIPLQATPFMALRRETEKYLMGLNDAAALRSVRMLIAVCQAQTDRIMGHLDEHGVSVGLVYSVERMRAQLSRMARLIDLRESPPHATHGMVQSMLADLIAAQHSAVPVQGLMHHSFSLLGRKLVERQARDGERYIARSRGQYRATLRAAAVGGVVAAGAVVGKLALGGGSGHFVEGLLVSLDYAASFVLISALGGVLAAKQPAITAPALAGKMGNLASRDGVRGLLQDIAGMLRAQAAAVFGNLGAVVPVMLLVALAAFGIWDRTPMTDVQAHAELQSLSLLSAAPLFAAFTGLLLWLSSLAAGLADNWFALRQLRSTIAHHRRLVYALGATRTARLARWMEEHVASIVGHVSLAALLGVGPAVLHFVGLPLDVRHVTLSAGELVAAAASLGWDSLTSSEFWLAGAGIAVIGFLNVAVAFVCALMLALRSRKVPARVRRMVWRSLLRRFSASPLSFFFPDKQERVLALVPGSRKTVRPSVEDGHSKTGS